MTVPRLRLSLRTLLVLVTACALAFGYVMYRARSQTAAIRALGAKMVVWDYQLPEGDASKWDPAAPEPGPSWFRDETNVGLFSRVRGVILVNPEVKREIGSLRALPGLVILNLSGSDVDDDALAEVARLTDLQSLNLDWTPITDAGVAKLAPLEELQALWLNNTHVTDASLTGIARFGKLRRLYLEGTGVTKAGVADLQKALPDCEIWWGAPSAPQTTPGAIPGR